MASCLRFCLDKSISSDTDEAADSGGDLKYRLTYLLVHKQENRLYFLMKEGSGGEIGRFVKYKVFQTDSSRSYLIWGMREKGMIYKQLE